MVRPELSPIDKRADIWAFGVVLFEMLSGTRAFPGDTLTDVLAAVVHKDPAWDCLPAAVPSVVRRLLRRCLAKFVRSVAPGGDARQVSIAGGTEPRWARAGGEIFYRAGQKMMVAQVRTEPALDVSAPRVLFEGPYEVIDGPINYDVTPDGHRFLMIKMEGSEAPAELKVVTGWDQELRKALSVTR